MANETATRPQLLKLSGDTLGQVVERITLHSLARPVAHQTGFDHLGQKRTKVAQQVDNLTFSSKIEENHDFNVFLTQKTLNTLCFHTKTTAQQLVNLDISSKFEP